jgi:HK97 family phage major capsid protein
MTASNSSFLNSSYSQNVVQSLKSSGLYRELGVRVENINDGKFVYPRESAFAATGMYDLNNSNSISAGDPTLDSVTLEAKALAGLTVLSRNLIAQESVNLENYVQNSLINSMNRTLDAQILVGSGSGANLQGVLNGAGNEETYTAGGSMAFADLLASIKKVQADGINVSGCAFVFHPDEYETFVNADRGTDSGNYVINPELQSGSHMVGRCLGIPVYVNDQMSSGNAVFGDFSRSVVGFHGGGAILEVDNYYDFAKGSVAVRLIEDVSFGILNANAFCSIKEAS